MQGIVVQQVVIRPLIGGPVLSAIIATLGLNIVLNSVAGLIWGHQTYTFPSPFAFSAPFMVGGVPIAVDSVVNIAVGLAIVVGMTLFLRFTWTGLGLRAASQNQTVARLMGVSITRTSAIAWGLGGLVGGIAGILVAPSLFLDTNLMGALLIKAFAGGVLGGLNSLIGVFLGCLALGVAENLAGAYVSPSFARGDHLHHHHRRADRPARGHSRPRQGPQGMSAAAEIIRGRQPPTSRSLGRGAVGLCLAAGLRCAVRPQRLRPLSADADRNLRAGRARAQSAHRLCRADQPVPCRFLRRRRLCDRDPDAEGGRALSAVAVCWARLLTTAIGAIVAIPALRLKNLYLAIATLGFGVVLQKIIFEWRGLTGGGGGLALSAAQHRRIRAGRDRALLSDAWR